jgi:hypothetical protein
MKKSMLQEFLAGKISVVYLLQRFLAGFIWSLRKTKVWLIWAVMGLIMGAIFSFFYPREYVASITMGIEEEKVGGFESLMAQFGLDAGGLNPGGVFEGESLITLFYTRNIIESTLDTRVKHGKDSLVFADVLWKQTSYFREPKFSGFSFSNERWENTALRDTAMYLLYKYSKKKLLSISKPDKKQAFVIVSCKHKDAWVAHRYCELLVDRLSGYYIEVITSKARNNLRILRQEADSLHRVLQRDFHYSASLGDMNVNPLRQVMKVDQSRAMVDLQIAISMYGEIAKQMKLAEISLRKQTPLVQVVDFPKFPYDRVGWSLLEYCAIGMFFGTLLGILLIWRLYDSHSP